MSYKSTACKTIATTIILILCGTTPALADGAYEIYTYGSGDFVAQVLRGVALVMSGGYIQTLIKVVLLVGILTALLNPITSWLSSGGGRVGDGGSGGEGFIVILRQVLLAVVVMYIFIIPKANVAIIDRYDASQSQVVSDVPFIQAIIAHGASMIGDVIGREMETAFSLPDAMTFRNAGLGVGIKHINNIYNILPPGPDMGTESGISNPQLSLVSLSLREYLNNCVFPNFAALDGPDGPKTKALNDLYQSRDFFATLQTHANVFADSSKSTASPLNSGGTTCGLAPSEINTAWKAGKTEWIQYIERESQSGISMVVLERYFPNGGDYFTMLQTIAAGNMLRSAVLGLEAKSVGHGSQVADKLSLASTVGGWQTTAKMFEKIVHVMRNVFEGLIYGLSVFLPVAIAVAGLKPIGVYMKIVLWLQLWVPFYVLLNLFGDMELARSLSAISIENNGSFPPLASWFQVGEKAQTSLAYLGSLSFTIPMFAWGLMQGGSYAMASAVRGMSGGSATAAAQSIGGQTGLDSVQYGNRGTYSFTDRSNTAQGAGWDANSRQMTQSAEMGTIKDLGLTQGQYFSQKTSFGVNQQAGSNFGFETSKQAGHNSGLANMDSFTVGKISAEQQISNARGETHSASLVGKTTQQNMTDRAFTTKGSESVSVARTQEKVGNLSDAIYGQGDKRAADITAETRVTSEDRQLRADVQTQKGVGDAKGIYAAALSYGTTVEKMSQQLTGFDNMNKMEKLEAFKIMSGGKGELDQKTKDFAESTYRTVTRATEGGAKVTEAYGTDGKKGFTQRASGSDSTHYAGSTTTVKGHDEKFIGAGKEGTAERAAWNAIDANNKGDGKRYRSEMQNIAEAIVGRGPNAMERLFGNRDHVEVLKNVMANAAQRYGDETGQDQSYASFGGHGSIDAGVRWDTGRTAAGKAFALGTGITANAGINAGLDYRMGSQGSTTVQTEKLKSNIHGKIDQVAADNTTYKTAGAKMKAITGYTAEVSNSLRDVAGKGNVSKAFTNSSPIPPDPNAKGPADTARNVTEYSAPNVTQKAHNVLSALPFAGIISPQGNSVMTDNSNSAQPNGTTVAPRTDMAPQGNNVTTGNSNSAQSKQASRGKRK